MIRLTEVFIIKEAYRLDASMLKRKYPDAYDGMEDMIDDEFRGQAKQIINPYSYQYKEDSGVLYASLNRNSNEYQKLRSMNALGNKKDVFYDKNSRSWEDIENLNKSMRY